MKRHDPWMKLVTVARRASAPEATDLPFGFAERVAAQGLARRPDPTEFFGVFAARALGLALAVLITSVAIGYPLDAKTADSSTDDLDDPVAGLVAQL